MKSYTLNCVNRKKMTIAKLLIVSLIAGLLAGCTVTQDYERPQIDVPQDWRISYHAAADLADTVWWEQFKDETLNKLISTALNDNKDLRIAIARVERFAGRMQASQAGYYPQVGYGGDVSRSQQSLERATPLGPFTERINSNYQAVFGIGWELDVWGRIKRSTEAARADLLAAEEGRRAVVLTLVSTLASSYVELLSLDSQLQISRRTMASREEWVRIFETKSKGGQISELELAQVRSAFEEVAVTIPALERRIAQQENYISLLLGSNPGLIERDNTLEKLIMPEVPQGIPSDLLIRRPDILQSEQRLIAANARIGVTRTQYFPTISLTGLLGFVSTDLSNFLQGSSNLWEYGVGLNGPLFTGGRIEGEIIQSEALYQQLLYHYLQTIQTAFSEVNDSLIAIKKQKEQLVVEKRHVLVLNDYIRYSQSRYDTGYTPYITVLDAQRRLYAAEIKYSQTQNNIFSALVSLYKAMAGGWLTKADQLILPLNEVVNINQLILK